MAKELAGVRLALKIRTSQSKKLAIMAKQMEMTQAEIVRRLIDAATIQEERVQRVGAAPLVRETWAG